MNTKYLLSLRNTGILSINNFSSYRENNRPIIVTSQRMENCIVHVLYSSLVNDWKEINSFRGNYKFTVSASITKALFTGHKLTQVQLRLYLILSLFRRQLYGKT